MRKNKKYRKLIKKTTRGHFLRNSTHFKLRLQKQSFFKALFNRKKILRLKKRNISRKLNLMIQNQSFINISKNINKDIIYTLKFYEPLTYMLLNEIVFR